MNGGRLDDFTRPICTGLTPAHGGRLSPARAAELDAQLRELDEARRHAALTSRFYLIGRHP